MSRAQAKRLPRRAAALRSLRIGCGVDVVELQRLRRAMERGGRAFMRRIFTKREETYARSRPRTSLLHLAGRFAAKEAVIKAMSQIDPARPLGMKDVEICNDRLGRPHVLLRDGKVRRVKIYVSLSHVDTMAVASALVTT